MNSLQKKRYLQGYRTTYKAINYKIEALKEKRIQGQCKAANFSSMPKSGYENRLQSTIDLTEILEMEINMDIKTFYAIKISIRNGLMSLEEKKHREVIKCIYVDGLGIEEIAQKLGYSQRWVYKLHKEALERIKISI